jgi:hypothetical protein
VTVLYLMNGIVLQSRTLINYTSGLISGEDENAAAQLNDECEARDSPIVTGKCRMQLLELVRHVAALAQNFLKVLPLP